MLIFQTKRFPKSWRPQRPQPFRNTNSSAFQLPPPMFQPTWQWKNHWENALGDHLASRPFIAWVIVLSPKHGNFHWVTSSMFYISVQWFSSQSNKRKSYQKYSSSNFHKFWVALSTFHYHNKLHPISSIPPAVETPNLPEDRPLCEDRLRDTLLCKNWRWSGGEIQWMRVPDPPWFKWDVKSLTPRPIIAM